MSEKTRAQDRFADAVCALGLLMHGDPAKVDRETTGRIVLNALFAYEQDRGDIHLYCGHTLADLIGGTEPDGRPCVTKCGACLADRQKAKSAS